MELYGRDVFIVHFGELWLRGRNRGEYISALNRNLREAIGDKCPIINLRDRLAVYKVNALNQALQANAAANATNAT